MKKRIITLLAILAVMVACAVFAVQAEAPEVTTTFVCPCTTCTAARTAGTTTTNNATWTKLTDSDGNATIDQTISTGGHYYIDEDLSVGSVGVSGKTIVLLIDNATLTTTNSRGMNSTAKGTLHLVGNNGAKWEVSTTSSMGGIAQMGAASTASAVNMNFYGDLTIQRRAESTGEVAGYGLIKNTSGTIHVHDYGTAQGLSTNNDPTFYGVPTKAASTTDASNANIFWNQSGTAKKYVIIDAGTFYCADSGYGAIHAGSNTTVTINGGTFVGAGASNIIYNTSTLNINEGTFTGGTGRVIYTSGTTTITDGTFTGGTGVVFNVTTAGELNIHGGDFSSSNTNVVYSSGAVVMDGGNITGTTTSARVYLNKGTMLLNGDATVLGPDGSKYTGNICITPDSKLHIAKTWTGKTSFKMRNADGSVTDATPGSTNIGNYNSKVTPTFDDDYWVRCVVVADDGTVSFNTTSNDSGFSNNAGCELYAESPDTENPRVNSWEYTLMPYRCQIVRKSGTTWSVDYKTAVNDVANEKDIYIKVWATNRAFTVDADQTVYIDLNGRNYTSKATVNGKLYVFDSKAEAGKAGHTIQATNVEPLTQINGSAYVNQIATVDSKSIVTTYPVEVKISKANLRLATAGIYYTAAVTCADEIKGNLIYGVAVQLGGEIEKLADAAYTAALVNSDAAGAGNSLIVNSILYKDAEGNVVANAKERSNTAIYAKAYLAVGTDVENFDTTNVVLGDSVEFSLTELMGKVDEKYAKAEADGGFTADQKTMINEFCAKFATAAEWVLPNILGTEA